MAVQEARRTNGDAPLQRAILTNGKSDGAVYADYVTMALAALVPALLAERAERAFVIGYGTGAWQEWQAAGRAEPWIVEEEEV